MNYLIFFLLFTSNILFVATGFAEQICNPQLDLGLDESTGGLLGKSKKDPPCDIKLFSKLPCECANQEPKITQGISKFIRQPLMRKQKLEDRVLSANKVFWERKIQNMFHDVLFFDAILTDPKMKHIYENGYPNPQVGAQNMVRNMGQCSFASMEKNWKEAFEPEKRNELFENEVIEEKTGLKPMLQDKCRNNRTLAESRFKKLFGSNDIKGVLDNSYKKNLTAISNNELLAPAQCLPYKGFTQVSAIPSNVAFLIGQKKADGSFMDKDTYIKEQEKKIKLKKSELSVLNKKDINYDKKSKELNITINSMQSNLTNFMTSVASNPLLGTLFSDFYKGKEDRAISENFRKSLIGKTDKEVQAILSDPKQVEPLLKVSMEKQNDKCAELFAVALPKLLCQDEIVPTPDLFDNADLSDFDELDQRTFFMTTMCEKKDGEWDYKPGANQRIFKGGQSNYQTPLEGFELFANKVNDKKINNKEVVQNNTYAEADKLFCKLAPECVPKNGISDPKCSDPNYMHEKFSKFIQNDFDNSMKNNGAAIATVEEKNWASQFAFYYGGFLGDQSFNCQVSLETCDPKNNLPVPNLAFNSKKSEESSVFTNYVVGSTVSDYENLSSPGSNGVWEPKPDGQGRVASNSVSPVAAPISSTNQSSGPEDGGNNNRSNKANLPSSNNQFPASNVDPISGQQFTQPTPVSTVKNDSKDKNEQAPSYSENPSESNIKPKEFTADIPSPTSNKNKNFFNDWEKSNNPTSSQNYQANNGQIQNNSNPTQPYDVSTDKNPRNPASYPNRENFGEASAKSKGGIAGDVSNPSSANSKTPSSLSLGDGLLGGFNEAGEWIDEERLVPHGFLKKDLKKGIERFGLEGKRFRSIEETKKGFILRTFEVELTDENGKPLRDFNKEELKIMVDAIKFRIFDKKISTDERDKLRETLRKVSTYTKKVDEKLITDQQEIEFLIAKTMTIKEVNYYFMQAVDLYFSNIASVK